MSGADRASRLGARLGRWNDQLGYGRGRTILRHAGRRWLVIDRVAGWLYTLPDRRRSDGLFGRLGR